MSNQQVKKPRYADTAVPETVFTPELLFKYKERVKLRPVMKKNAFGGRNAELYIDDSVNNDGVRASGDRKLVIEVPDCSSTFGISSMKSDTKTESGEPKDSLSLAFALRNNAVLQTVADCLDDISKREVCRHWESLSGGQKKAEELL
jgi:hypothetical protein